MVSVAQVTVEVILTLSPHHKSLKSSSLLNSDL